ncbi:hypothetical protein C5469_01180 [Photorhabdus cinerea]|uniref:Ner winged helix-turn-helix DNA-binding domain-containing protein n=1 Tax=Photorhabdus cinerea TaxID=471575 RepID=A0A7X5QAP0_9GAMM|nr:hypothetical protein [Photorhabdus cinerea]
MNCPWSKDEWIIASYLEIHLFEIWPGRYFDMDGQLIERLIYKVSTE